METGLLHLHNILRWVILLLLLVVIIQALAKKSGITKTSLWLMIAAHTTLLLGVYQWFTSDKAGLAILKNMDNDFGAVMKNSFARFWVVEHFAGMLIAIIFITIARGKAKALNYKAAAWLYILALLIILVVIPWPFRELIGRPWFPGIK
ncbi:MAG: hypothetical protein EPN92_08795 [Chitinophagaceae bacterium]|nr:MAG: hypothetical protein EPN92_08795 [Chitinophagaceae bacterium]